MTRIFILTIILALTQKTNPALFTNYTANETVSVDYGLNLYRKEEFCNEPSNYNQPNNSVSLQDTYLYDMKREEEKGDKTSSWLDHRIPEGAGLDKIITTNSFHGANYTYWMQLGTKLSRQEWLQVFTFNYITPKIITYKFDEDYTFKATVTDG